MNETERTDTERLNWLEEQSSDYGRGWIFRRRSEGGAALHQTFREGAKPTAREAVDAAMRVDLEGAQ